MGGLVGGLYATGHSPAELERIVKDVNWSTVISGETRYLERGFRRQEDLRALPNSLELGLKQGLRPAGGLIFGQPVRSIIAVRQSKYVPQFVHRHKNQLIRG